ncbi:MAG: sigma 54-interacting transcriptional regulator [Desulfitobacteriaceae bacterium]|nr:sigma 54-interacting transcriptional regulator [Desulfitobacteriaceae bacterium]MDI6879240.1 sigma 54-interacting transcriptional regulator [Desulfitobacteriaceae bacterium]MDI6913720.1 sigma 54-interacting transcriptional regulator [Desulfitobacteriaceae bacterium]
MLMSDMMTRDIPLLHPEDSLEAAARFLRLTKLDGLPVVSQEERLMGIFTRTNLIDAFLNGAGLADRIEGFYNQKAVTVRVDTTYAEVERIVKNSPVGTGVVVNAEGSVLGIFTKVDMIMALFKEADQLAGKLNTLYQAMHNGVIVVDRNHRIQYLNQSGETILGLKKETLQGCLFNSVFPHLDLKPVLKEGRVLVGIQEKLNTVKALCNISPIFEGGGTSGAVIIFQPLTDLDQVASELETTKRLYETLLTITNIAYEAIIVVDEEGMISLVNEAACKFFGKSEPELLQQPVDHVIENTRLPRALKTGMAETNEIQVIQGRPYIVSRLPIVRNGKVIGAVGKIVYQRIEEVKEVAERLIQMEQELTYYKAKAGTEEQLVTFNQIVTINSDMRRLKQEAEMVARGNSTVMLSGESGTGKELFAEAIHQASLRRKGPFVKINCAAVPENLLESEFFGYAGGAFTGAQKGGKPGKFALADGGTLFLDEIGDMSLNLQSKLLRVLEDRAFEPVGSNLTVKVDVRIIAATNQDLLQKVETGEFRRDLYYRLNVVNFRLISLRYRQEDVIPLVRVFLERLNRDFGKQIQDASAEVQAMLLKHHWPGNVRELKNVIERAVNFASGPLLEVEHLPFYLREGGQEKPAQAKYNPEYTSASPLTLDQESIRHVLEKTKGNKSQAARILGISRSWFYEKLREYHLE